MKKNILTPSIEEYTIKVTLAISTPIDIPNNTNLEKFFETQSNNARNYMTKAEFERARSLFKYASCFGITPLDVQLKSNKLFVLFSFNSLDELTEFSNSMRIAVTTAMNR